MGNSHYYFRVRISDLAGSYFLSGVSMDWPISGHWSTPSMSIWKAQRYSDHNWAEVTWHEVQVGDGLVDIDELEWDAWESVTVRLADGTIFRSTDQGESWQLFMTRRERLEVWWYRTWLSLCQLTGRIRL